MKDLIIKNIADVEPTVIDRGTNTFTKKSVVGGADIDSCEVAFIEVPVGEYAFGHHYHDQSEEVFYIVSGAGRLRHAGGETDVKAGDMLCFPNGEKGAHVVSNTSDTEPLIFIDFDVRKPGGADIVVFPDMGKMAVIPANGPRAMVDLPTE